MKLTKAQRSELRQKFGGRCAYCGCELGERWHADHFEPVCRNQKYVRGKGFVHDGTMYAPQNDTIDNMMPSCAPCNIDKHAMSLESWRQKLQGACGVLQRNVSTYRHALRFGLVTETQKPIVFYFEQATS